MVEELGMERTQIKKLHSYGLVRQTDLVVKVELAKMALSPGWPNVNCENAFFLCGIQWTYIMI